MSKNKGITKREEEQGKKVFRGLMVAFVVVAILMVIAAALLS